MINSLFKDSHITQSLLHSQISSGSSANNRTRQQYSSATVNKSSIIVRKPAEINFSGLSSANKPFDIYTNKTFKYFLAKAKENNVVFSAGFSLLLTCLLRPASIMALPADKKNKDDKKYAAAHSIASGIIGFVISLIVANPISDAVKKMLKDPKEYLPKNAEWLKSSKNVENVANAYLNKIPDVLMAAPKGIVTIALIPVILKYVFGWEKKKTQEKITNTPKEINGGVK